MVGSEMNEELEKSAKSKGKTKRRRKGSKSSKLAQKWMSAVNAPQTIEPVSKSKSKSLCKKRKGIARNELSSAVKMSLLMIYTYR